MKATNFENIDLELCNYCGTCVGICPSSALTARNERIIFDKDKCISCGLCYSNCPGIEVDFKGISDMLKRGTDPLLGGYKGIYIARSKDEDVLKGSSSGGVVSSILIKLLKEKKIDGAIVLGMDEKRPGMPKAYIARTRDEVLAAQGSKYTMFALNSILKSLPDGDYAIVGLPCHLHGIRKLQQKGHAKYIKYFIGLFCGFNVESKGTYFFLKKLGIRKQDIKSLKYRAGRWPGGFEVITRKGEKKFLPKYYYDITDAVFIPRRCLQCIDYMAEFSDISVGDIYLPELNREKWCAVITRSEAGEKMIEGVESRKLSRQKLIGSHMHNINHKKKGAFFRMGFGARPDYKMPIPKFSAAEKIKLGIPALIFWTTRTGLFKFLLGLVPLKLMGAVAYLRRKILKKTV